MRPWVLETVRAVLALFVLVLVMLLGAGTFVLVGAGFRCVLRMLFP